jgi:hypothetical protein
MRNSPILCARKVRRITVVNDGEISGIVSLKTLYKVAWEVPCHYRRAWRLVGTVPLVVSVDLTGHFAEHSDEQSRHPSIPAQRLLRFAHNTDPSFSS